MVDWEKSTIKTQSAFQKILNLGHISLVIVFISVNTFLITEYDDILLHHKMYCTY